MTMFILPDRDIIWILAAWLLVACQSEKNRYDGCTSVQSMFADEAAIYASLVGIKNYISAGQWDEWLALYADNAILANG